MFYMETSFFLRRCVLCQRFCIPAPHLDGAAHTVLCQDCLHRLLSWKSVVYKVCPRCGSLLFEWDENCHRCQSITMPPWLTMSCIGEYRGIGKKIIGQYKFKDNRKLGELFAALYAGHLRLHFRENMSRILLVPVPSYRGNIKRRGYDHMTAVANRVGRTLGCSSWNLLEHPCGEKKKAGRFERLEKPGYVLVDDIADIRESLESGRYTDIVLLDDVRTTGSTILACAGLLHSYIGLPIYALTLCDEP